MTDPAAHERPAPVRTLILLRHGKSDYPGDTRDFDRPLAPRGEVGAAAAGRWIRAHQPPVDRVLCSAALRTRETFTATGIDAEVTYSKAIYEALPADLLREIREVDPAVQTLLVVGHAPGTPGLAHLLADDNSDQAALEELSQHFPTSALAVLTVHRSWSALDDGGASLTVVHVARD